MKMNAVRTAATANKKREKRDKPTSKAVWPCFSDRPAAICPVDDGPHEHASGLIQRRPSGHSTDRNSPQDGRLRGSRRRSPAFGALFGVTGGAFAGFYWAVGGERVPGSGRFGPHLAPSRRRLPRNPHGF